LLLGATSLALALCSFCVVLASLGGIPLAFAVGRMADYDFGRMDAGLLDAGGRGMTVWAARLALAAVVCNLASWMVCPTTQSYFWDVMLLRLFYGPGASRL
jgi:hypothetical protein